MIKYKNYSNLPQNSQKIHFPLLLQLPRKIRLVWLSTIRILNPNVYYIRGTPSNFAKTHSQKYVRAKTYICITRLKKPTSNSNSTQNSDLFQKKKIIKNASNCWKKIKVMMSILCVNQKCFVCAMRTMACWLGTFFSMAKGAVAKW